MLPIVVELVIPTPFLKTTAVNSADAIVHTVDADFIGTESYNIAMLDVGGVNCTVFLLKEPFYEDPER